MSTLNSSASMNSQNSKSSTLKAWVSRVAGKSNKSIESMIEVNSLSRDASRGASRGEGRGAGLGEGRTVGM